MNAISISRTGMPPIRFTGEIIGEGTTRHHNSTRWTNVRIYATKGGKFVAEVQRRTQWQGERDTTNGNSFSTAAECIEWLAGETGTNGVGVASQEAIEAAAKVNDQFGAAWVENVE